MAPRCDVVVEPTSEVWSLEELKDYLQVDHDADDAILTALLMAARQEAQSQAARSFVTQTRVLSLDGWPADGVIRLQYPPVASVESVTYYGDDNTLYTMPAADYVLIADVNPPVIVLAKDATWPSETLRPVSPVRVRYVAGYGAATAVPMRYRLWVAGLVAVGYENRDSVVTSPNANADRQREWLYSALKTDWGWAE
jgi:uncharacterized phiE125 gp8 family phage protein